MAIMQKPLKYSYLPMASCQIILLIGKRSRISKWYMQMFLWSAHVRKKNSILSFVHLCITHICTIPRKQNKSYDFFIKLSLKLTFLLHIAGIHLFILFTSMSAVLVRRQLLTTSTKHVKGHMSLTTFSCYMFCVSACVFVWIDYLVSVFYNSAKPPILSIIENQACPNYGPWAKCVPCIVWWCAGSRIIW